MLTAKQFAALHGVTQARIRQLCIAGRIKDAVKFGRDWMIPDKSTMPEDARVTRHAKKK